MGDLVTFHGEAAQYQTHTNPPKVGRRARPVGIFPVAGLCQTHLRNSTCPPWPARGLPMAPLARVPRCPGEGPVADRVRHGAKCPAPRGPGFRRVGAPDDPAKPSPTVDRPWLWDRIPRRFVRGPVASPGNHGPPAAPGRPAPPRPDPWRSTGKQPVAATSTAGFRLTQNASHTAGLTPSGGPRPRCAPGRTAPPSPCSPHNDGAQRRPVPGACETRARSSMVGRTWQRAAELINAVDRGWQGSNPTCSHTNRWRAPLGAATMPADKAYIRPVHPRSVSRRGPPEGSSVHRAAPSVRFSRLGLPIPPMTERPGGARMELGTSTRPG